jgi:hypothetical protein
VKERELLEIKGYEITVIKLTKLTSEINDNAYNN